VVAAYPSASAKNARDFLEKLIERTPFEVKAIQVDGGSEFMAEFEAACREFGVKLFVLPPRSPKLNGQVERAHRSHVQEFYDYYVGELSIEAVNRALRAWEETFNTLRPHQAESPSATARSIILRPSTRTGCPTVSNVLNPYRSLQGG
jgi:putative transposase